MKTILTDKELKKLEGFLNSPSSGLSFEVGNFNIPMKLPYSNGNLMEHRLTLLNSMSNGESAFVGWLRSELASLKGIYTILQQFPIPIQDEELWIKCCKKYNRMKYKDRRYFVLDVFIPDIGLVMEVDYNITHDCEYDKARDEYLSRKYQIVTRRYFGYNSNDFNNLKIRSRALNDLSDNCMRFYDQMLIDFTPTILSYFNYKYRMEIEVFKKVLNRRLRLVKKTEGLSSKFISILEEIGIHFPSKPYI